jgi:hypothetical protein
LRTQSCCATDETINIGCSWRESLDKLTFATTHLFVIAALHFQRSAVLERIEHRGIYPAHFVPVRQIARAIDREVGQCMAESDGAIYVKIFIDDEREACRRLENRSAVCVSEDLRSNRSAFVVIDSYFRHFCLLSAALRCLSRANQTGDPAG